MQNCQNDRNMTSRTCDTHALICRAQPLRCRHNEAYLNETNVKSGTIYVSESKADRRARNASFRFVCASEWIKYIVRFVLKSTTTTNAK